MATWVAQLLPVLLGITSILHHVKSFTADRPDLCATMPELYFANVAGRIPGGVDILSVGDQTLCPKGPRYPQRYRELDGRCNHPLDMGSTMKPVKRYIKAHYQDPMGYNTPRTFSVHGTLLPSPRAVSTGVHTDRRKKDRHTMWLMQLGQFIDHDITSAPVPTEYNSSIRCCGVRPDQIHKDCFPITIPKRDPVFDTCMEFVRSEPFKDNEGNVRYPREQINALTSFLDGSAIYGSDAENLASLRVGRGYGALLKTMMVNGKERLPRDIEPDQDMCLVSHGGLSFCQLSGDHRVNEQPGLGSSHLLFHLYHNHIVRSLTSGFLARIRQPSTRLDVEIFLMQEPTLPQEILFQEARKIVSGVLQKITYCDWLPLIVGPALIRKYSLGCYGRSDYNHFVDPRIANVFLAAAFRFGHSLIPNKIRINDVDLDLKDQFMIPDATLYYYESIVYGLQQKGSQQRFDRHVVHAVTNHLFESSNGPKGALDLVSLNIQRGRDHGIPAYHVWRKYYGLRKSRGFADFRGSAREMRRLYRHFHDVDLFVGGLLERSVRGGVVGETFGNIIANQFADIKFGDAHFFMGKESPRGFTDEQLAVIKTVTLRDVVCTCGGVDRSQGNVFLEPSDTNPRKSCYDRKEFDTAPWMDIF